MKLFAALITALVSTVASAQSFDDKISFKFEAPLQFSTYQVSFNVFYANNSAELNPIKIDNFNFDGDFDFVTANAPSGNLSFTGDGYLFSGKDSSGLQMVFSGLSSISFDINVPFTDDVTPDTLRFSLVESSTGGTLAPSNHPFASSIFMTYEMGQDKSGLVVYDSITDRGTWSASFASDMAAPIPEPSSYAMLFAGLLMVGAIVKRRTS